MNLHENYSYAKWGIFQPQEAEKASKGKEGFFKGHLKKKVDCFKKKLSVFQYIEKQLCYIQSLNWKKKNPNKSS